jgi:hypothetical protein
MRFLVAATCALHSAGCGTRAELLPTDVAPDAGRDGSTHSATDDAAIDDDASVNGDATVPMNDAAIARDSGTDAQSPVLPELTYVKASNPDANDWFGQAIALTDRFLAVGATNESSWATGIDGDQDDDSEDGSGAVYLFSNDGSSWSQRHYIKASNAGAVDGFGSAVALHGSTLAVGAPFEDSPATGIDGDQGDGQGGNHGAVYIFVEDGGVWRQEAYVKASNTDWVDLFGYSVALEGDTLVVGAPFEDSASGIDGDQEDDSVENCGAAYVFERTAAGWEQTAYLKASNSVAGDELGTAVAISGTTIAVGARGDGSSGFEDSGAVYVFEREGSSYLQTAVLKASELAADAAFGSVVALHGDTLVVGAPSFASGPTRADSGAAYIFERRGEAWSQTAFIEASSPIEQTFFGVAVAIHEDTVLIGSIGDGHPQVPRAGASYVYERDVSGWVLERRIVAPNAQLGDRFGLGLAITPNAMAIGAIGEASESAGIDGDASNDSTPGAGAVFLYAR